jgi:hypothetical protein
MPCSRFSLSFIKSTSAPKNIADERIEGKVSAEKIQPLSSGTENVDSNYSAVPI